MMNIQIKLHYFYARQYNNNNKHFLIYKLLTPLVDKGSKPTCPEREVNVQNTVKTR